MNGMTSFKQYPWMRTPPGIFHREMQEKRSLPTDHYFALKIYFYHHKKRLLNGYDPTPAKREKKKSK